MKRKLYIFMYLLLVPIIMIGCTIPFYWNPTFHGTELNKRIAFTKEEIGLEINSLSFSNGRWGPKIKMQLKNFSNDTLFYSNENFKVVIGEDTLAFQCLNATEFNLNPGAKVKVELHYDYVFEDFKTITLKSGLMYISKKYTEVELIIGNFVCGSSKIEMPTLVYRNPKRIIKKEDGYTIVNTKF